MKNVVIFIFALGMCLSSFAYSHGGGVDSNGCHKDSSTGTRHCHTGSTSGGSNSNSSSGAATTAAIIIVVAGLGYWWYTEYKKGARYNYVELKSNKDDQFSLRINGNSTESNELASVGVSYEF